MTSDRDIYRAAAVLVKQHGQDAPIHATMRADAMLAKGDLGGYADWRRILLASQKEPIKDGGDSAGRRLRKQTPIRSNFADDATRI